MGSWGVGMQASDSALDAIYRVEEGYLKGKKVRGQTKAVKGKLGPNVIKWYTKLEDYSIKNGYSRQEILGVADWMLDKGILLKGVMSLLDKVVEKELDQKHLDCWRDGEARKEALKRFQKRLHGKKVDEEKLAEDNEGLMVKMDKFLGGR
jgi:hypothetical protein